ncbi:DUF4145 domain-containing protein [Pseudomonas gessardii]|uniref:DUF4145 domain-containing protein n=2 Tax=Pseudomonas gessardii TaxID=78544 RepID=A0ABS9FAH8_9PSED|nr:DUF4145 domain-containing protein [Pseudomonas gessardii]MCF5108543.1 DUF4145 domain-containing protein [Pseudomonas gessardii]
MGVRMSQGFVSPTYKKLSFTCPHCGALAGMKWHHLLVNANEFSPVSMSMCQACIKPAVWIGDDNSLSANPLSVLLGGKGFLIYPNASIAPPAEPDMPSDIKIDFEEARLVFNHSPRAAAALLRLCVQKLCQKLLGKKGDIHKQIGELVELGLPSRVLKAFDTIRIFGNESVHPGTVNLNETGSSHLRV